MSWTSFCQDTTTKEVKVSTLKKIKRDLDKCDSLRVAYNLQLNSFNDLINSNLEYFKKLQEEELKRKQLQEQLDDSVKALRRKKNNWLLPTSLGIVGGVVLGVVISN